MNLFLNSALKKITNHEGTLCVTEFKDLPFQVKRMFFVKNVPVNVERGNHAHKKNKQLLICVSGNIKVITHDGFTRHENIMEANDCVYLKEMIWDSQIFLNKEALLLVLASEEYDPTDYITDFTEFKKMIRNGTV